MIKKIWKYLLPVVLVYYFYPLYALNRPEVSSDYLIGNLIFINPIVVFISSLFYAFKYKLDIEFTLILSALFVPSALIFFNSSALIYVLVYFVLSLLAQYTGMHAQRKIK